MSEDRKDGNADPRQFRSSDRAVDRYRAERAQPKALARPLSDKMVVGPTKADGYVAK